tara:strand:+ start:1363 stop:2511 length:1149 start_codon:yes stop_codon:yes gene_type:complete
MNYLTRLDLCIVLVFALVGGFNFLVDPYGFYWSPALEGFNQQKTQADERVREVTPYRALALQPDTVLIGNSRVQLGIAAESKVLEGRKAYNLSLPGAGLTETLRHALSQARHNHNLTTMIIALDYRYFLHNYSQSPGPWPQEELLNTITQPPESTIARIKRIYPAVFSLDTLFDSVRTVAQQGGTYNNITRLGSNTGGYYLDAIKAEGKKRFYKHQFDGLYMRFGRQHLTYEANGTVYSTDLLTTFLDEMRKAHPSVNIYFFINPYHQSYWQVIYRSGHWGSYLKWKRDLARIADKYPEYPVYDFSLPSQQTLEPLNYAQDKQLMTWYWEPAHYRPALGDEVLKALLGHATTSTTGNWPIRLDAHTIEKAIKQSIDGLSQSD